MPWNLTSLIALCYRPVCYQRQALPSLLPLHCLQLVLTLLIQLTVHYFHRFIFYDYYGKFV